ncbi:hypothetical protein D3C73_1267120 [compost metagenome]
MTETVGATALGEIQIGTVIAVPQPGTLATDKHLLGPIDTGHQVLAAKIVVPGRGAMVRQQIIETGRLPTQAEQIHGVNPRRRFFALPMQMPSKQRIFIAFRGPVSLVNAVRLGPGKALSHFDLAAFLISITYGFQATALFRRCV